MHRNQHILSKKLTFSKWSRKNYAAFVSLKKIIKIARLSIDLCIASSHKNIKLSSMLAFLLKGRKTVNANQSDEPNPEGLLIDLSLAQACTINEVIDPKNNIISTYNISPLSAICR